MNSTNLPTYWSTHWKKFKKHKLGHFALLVVFAFCLVGIYAPFLASSKPFFVLYEGTIFFPLFRYLFYPEFFSKGLDLFFNLLIFTFPFFLYCWLSDRVKNKSKWLLLLCLLQFSGFIYILYWPIKNPEVNLLVSQERMKALKESPDLKYNWAFDLRYMTSYEKLNHLLRYKERKAQHQRLYANLSMEPATLWLQEQKLEEQQITQLKQILEEQKKSSSLFIKTTQEQIAYLEQRKQWREEESQKLQFVVMPLLSHFHWEDDAGGDQRLNQQLHWWDQTRSNRKDLLAALIFGVRISLVVGLLAQAIALAIGLPIGAIAGFYGGRIDIVVCRLLEVWEGMPTFFMLLMAVAMLQSKSIFIVITIIGFFGWTGFSRYLRGEFLKQRSLPYVEACFSMGFSNPYTMFVHILPNAIPPVLTLLPFAIMGAISSEAGLSFLGLGEESSCSWGVLMDEGRAAFPGESSLLWPPAAMLTLLLVAIALVGDALRDTLDPKMQGT